jgi:5-methylcytosine-specific restriction endonuclease McrA
MKKKKEPKAYNWDAKIMAALRKIWRFSPERKAALDAAANPENKQEVVCASCGAWTHVKLAKVDHVVPIVPVSGFDTWDAVIYRLRFGALQVLCEPCHKVKTKDENASRAWSKKLRKLAEKSVLDVNAAFYCGEEKNPIMVGMAEILQKACRKK